MVGTRLKQNRSHFIDPHASFNASLLERDIEHPAQQGGLTNEANRATKCTEHMITVSWTKDHGWKKPTLRKYGPISLMPTASVLQYATECFEGMKVYGGVDGQMRLFRPMLNCQRMLNSATRISLPSFEPAELLKLIQKLCRLDGPKWLQSDQAEPSLYIRPTMIGSDPGLGFDLPQEATLLIFIAAELNVKNPRSSQRQGLHLMASKEDSVRAWPGGTGAAKIGANYGPALLLHGEAREEGYDQVLWLLGSKCHITEAGSSNFFVIWRTEAGKLELVTPPLRDKTILPGVTRQSILDLARDRFAPGKSEALAIDHNVEPLEVLEKGITIFDVISAANDDRLISVFTSGTANFVMPVSTIDFRDTSINISIENLHHLTLLRNWLAGIMYGIESSEWGDVIDE